MADPESSQRESLESGPDSLTGILADVSVPFELRKPEEKPIDYPPVFRKCVERNWSKVCELMNWKKEGQAIDLSIFKLAKDPTDVIRKVQAEILSKGGTLEKYGQDGKFGPETEAGLKGALAQTSTLSATALTESPLEPVSRAPESVRERPQFTMRNFEVLIDVFKASDQRLTAAGLDIKGIDKTTVTPDVISAYKVKARAFRESLGRENPLLAKLCPIADEMIQVIEEEIKKIDISSVKNRQDFNDTIRDLVQSMEAKMEGLESQFLQVVTVAEKAQLEQMVKDGLEFKNLDQLELPMTFLMSAMNELALTAMEHFGKDPDAVENFVELMRIERMIPRKPMPRRVVAEDAFLTHGEVWTELVEHGPYEKKDGRFYFPHELPDGEEMSVSFDWDGMIQINNRRGLLKLPIGANISKIQALDNGNIQVTANFSGVERSIEVTKAELDIFLADLATGTPGPLYLAGLRVNVYEAFETVSPIDESWEYLVSRGLLTLERDGYARRIDASFLHQISDNRVVEATFWCGNFEINGHSGTLDLPRGIEVRTLQALPNGDLEFTTGNSAGKNTKQFTIKKADLRQFLTDLADGKPNAHLGKFKFDFWQ